MIFELENYMLPCFTKTIFGFNCLGCGLQRSFIMIINGNFFDAFKMYPAIYTLLFLFAFILINLKIQHKNGQKIIAKLAYLNLSIILINYLIKFNF